MTFDPERIPAGAVLGDGWRLTQHSYDRGGSTGPDLLSLEFARLTPAPDFLSRVAEVTASTPKEETMTPAEPTSHDYYVSAYVCARCQFLGKRGPWAMVETPMPVTAPESYPAEESTSYGVSKTVGETTVLLEADTDGDLETDLAYPNTYVYKNELSDYAILAAKVARLNDDTEDDIVFAIVEITTTKEIAPAKPPRPALPTALGSVVKVERPGRQAETLTFVVEGSTPKWRRTEGYDRIVGSHFVPTATVAETVVEILFDAGATA